MKSPEFFVTRKREVDKLIHFLEECKYSGSMDTKVDINLVIKTLAQDEFIIAELNKEIKILEDKVKILEEKIKKFDGQPEPPTKKIKKEVENIAIK